MDCYSYSYKDISLRNIVYKELSDVLLNRSKPYIIEIVIEYKREINH